MSLLMKLFKTLHLTMCVTFTANNSLLFTCQ